jgi:hypothetical protein
VVDAGGLLAVLAEAAGLHGPPQEHWSYWRCGRAVRTHYELVGWRPEHGTLAPGVSQIAVHVDRTDKQRVLSAVVAAPAMLGEVCRAVVTAAEGQSVRAKRLDGEQAPAAYGLCPTARPV